MIQISRLEGFFWVAKTEGYARAARAFPYPITQPAVHQQVRKLEEQVGTPLFERIGKDRVRLTPAGRHLFEFVAPFFERLPEVESKLRSGAVGGTLKIHAASLVIRQILPGWFGRLRRAHPEIAVDLHVMEELDFDLLKSGEADLIVDHMTEAPSGITTQPIATAYAFLVLPKGHALARKRKWTFEELSRDAFISYSPGTEQCELQLRFLAAHGLTPSRTLSASTGDTILGFVESGLGFSLLPTFDPTGIRTPRAVSKPLPGPASTFSIAAAVRKRSLEDPIVSAALEHAVPR